MEVGGGKGEGEEKGSDERRVAPVGVTVTLALPHLWACHLACGEKMTAAGPRRAAATSLKQRDKLGECERPDSAAVSVLIRHGALSELATRQDGREY